MSRTIRRKNDSHIAAAYTCTQDEFHHNVSWLKGSDPKHYPKYVAKKVAWFHSDKPKHFHIYKGTRACPRNLRNIYVERPFRQEVRRKIHHAARNESWDDFGFRAPRHDSRLYR